MPIAYALGGALISYILSWIIYGILRATCLKKISLKLKEKKGVRYFINAPISLLFVIFFGISLFNPVNFILKETNSLTNVTYSLKDNQTLKEKMEEINTLKSSANEIYDTLTLVENDLNEMEETVLDYEKQVNELTVSYNELVASVESSLTDCATLKTKSLSSEDKIKVNEIEKILNNAKIELGRYKKSVADASKQVEDGKKEVQSALDEVTSSKKEIKSGLGSLDDSLDSIICYQEELNKLYEEYGDYIPLFKESVIFSWLFDINLYGTYNFSYNDENYSSKDSLNDVIDYMDYVSTSMIDEIAVSLSSALKTYQEELNKGKEEALEAKKEVEEKKETLSSYQDEIDEAKSQLDDAIKEYNDKIYVLEDLKTKYNI